MSQHDYNIANQLFPATRSDINNALSAILSTNSGSSAPSTTVAYMSWADTTNGELKIRNAADSDWISLRELTGEVISPLGSASSPSIYFTGDTNTGIFSPGADTYAISTGGTERLRVDSSGNVGIANSSPGAPLDIVGRVFIDSDGNGLSGDGFLAIGEAGVGTGAAITLGSDSSSFSQIAFSDGDSGMDRLSGLIKYTHSSDTLEIWAGQTARMKLVTGVQIGSPTGGDKGAGTINAAGDIYKNNSAYTNPDYVFERYFKGKIEKFIENEGAKEYLGLTCITKLEEKMKNTLRLPGMNGDSKGIFGRADFVLEKLEEAYLYIIQLHNRLSILEDKS